MNLIWVHGMENFHAINNIDLVFSVEIETYLVVVYGATMICSLVCGLIDLDFVWVVAFVWHLHAGRKSFSFLREHRS